MICGVRLDGLRNSSTRTVCQSLDCRGKRDREAYLRHYNAKKKAREMLRASGTYVDARYGEREEAGPISSARRSQGRFFVPDRQEKLCKEVKEGFICWACGAPHPFDVVAKLRVQCSCTALYTLSLGEGANGPSIVRVDRWL